MRLLADPQRRRALRDRARSHADSWTYVQYFDQLARLIEQALRPSDERLAFDPE